MDPMDRLYSMDDLAGELDYDYSVNEHHIATMRQFREELLEPYLDPDRMLFFRGERVSSLARPLLPTLFRDREVLIPEGECCADVTSDSLLALYRSFGRYFDLFCSTFGHAHKYRLYDLCAFSQHYLNFSPLIDFTKSLHVALSFGLKGKREFEDDGVLYTVEISERENYTRSPPSAGSTTTTYGYTIWSRGRRDRRKRSVPRRRPGSSTSPQTTG